MEEERQRLYEQTQRDAQTKSDLLNEVNHRVKNNLMAIQGLLLVEQRYVPAPARASVDTALGNLSRRIDGLLRVHQMLSDSHWSPISVTDLAHRLIHAATQALEHDRNVAVEIAPSDIKISPRQASNLALVLNELATNTIKFALPECPQIRITVRSWKEKGWIGIEYRDDGPGYPEEVLRRERHNVGLRLVQSLVTETLGGTLTLANLNGALVEMKIAAD